MEQALRATARTLAKGKAHAEVEREKDAAAVRGKVGAAAEEKAPAASKAKDAEREKEKDADRVSRKIRSKKGEAPLFLGNCGRLGKAQRPH